jgi:hypothetical protein
MRVEDQSIKSESYVASSLCGEECIAVEGK